MNRELYLTVQRNELSSAAGSPADLMAFTLHGFRDTPSLENIKPCGEAELQGTARKKLQYDLAKMEDVRLKAMEKLSETKKRGSSADQSDDKVKCQRRSGGDAIEYLAERAKVSDQLKEEDLKMKRDQQTLEREKMEVLSKHQIQMQQQQADMLKLMQQQQRQQQLLNSQMMMMQQQQQSKALMVLLEKIINK